MVAVATLTVRWTEGSALADQNRFGDLHEEHEPSIRASLARRSDGSRRRRVA